jgi:hypothetical protein
MPVVSNVPLVVLNPTSSASVPKISAPPFLGVADVTPLGWLELAADEELEPEPELQAANRPPEVPTTARPAPAAAPRAKNERRSIRSDMFPLSALTEAEPSPRLTNQRIRPSLPFERDDERQVTPRR